MATYPKREVVLPSDLVCVRNGYLDESRLAVIGEAGWLDPTAARAWTALWWNARAAGYDLTWTYGGTYRAYWQQVALFTQRWDNQKRVGPTAFYGGQQWWLKPGVARAAVPGTSNHGVGLAVDVASGTLPGNARPVTAATLGWLLGAAMEHGWSWELDSEPWHIRYWCGDQLPAAVLVAESEMAAAAGPGTQGFARLPGRFGRRGAPSA